MVNVRARAVSPWQAQGDLIEIQPGLFLLADEVRYDARRGLLTDSQPELSETLVQ
jgi:hypothetical protein